MKVFVLTFLFSVIFVHAQKSKNVAIVKFVRGSVKIQDPDNGIIVAKKGIWIKEGSMIQTGARSVAKLSFIDKSSMNVGPNSEMKVEKFAKDEAGVIEVLSGKIRSQVSKNYMDMKKGKSKLFVKSKSAVMGIRGTDFIFSTNKKNGQSSAVLFEGSVVFNKNDGKRRGPNALEALVDAGVRIKPGQFSVAGAAFKRPTLPAKLDSRQFRALNKNKNLDLDSAKTKSKRISVVPKGLTGNIVSNDINDLKNEIKKNFNMDVKVNKVEVNKEVVNGGKIGDYIKPADGSPLHIESSTVLPVSSNSTYDSNTNEWRSQDYYIDDSGDVQAKGDFTITNEGQLLKDDGTGKMEQVVYDIVSPMEQKPLDEMETQQLNINGPTPAGSLVEPTTQEVQDGVAPNGQDWFVPNSQVNQPRFIGPDGTRIPTTKVKVNVQQDGVSAP